MSDDDSDKTVTPPEKGEGWIIESLKWPKPKTEEKGGDEGEKGGGERKRKGPSSSECEEDLTAPSEYSDSDDEKPWIKPLLGECYSRGTCFYGSCIIVDRKKMWRIMRRHNLLMSRTIRRHEQQLEKLKIKNKKLEEQNATLKSLRTVCSIKKADIKK